jgi:biotin/methionine sulfoxide reductase
MPGQEGEREREFRPHSSHWGAFSAAATADGVEIRDLGGDPAPSSILDNVRAAPHHPARLGQPMVRKGWLEGGPGPSERRGREPFVALEWDEALDLLAAELRRVQTEYGAGAVYGGSYGWSSAGRFHHAQSQVHRFLNCAGGYTSSVNTYSAGASAVILPHVLVDGERMQRDWVTWPVIAERTKLIVAFGGIAAKNSQVGAGGASRHVVPEQMRRAAANGCSFVLVSPQRDDLLAELDARWLPVRPSTDVALMLALAYTLVEENRVDRDFLERCTAGYEVFERYLLGRDDGVPKSPAWAEPICELPAATIAELAREMAAQRTLVSVSYSLQRSQYGEQPVWMGVVLAAMLGQIGLQGGGYAFALGATANAGRPPLAVSIPALPQGRNAVSSFIPVARIADMLLQPGKPFDYDGRTVRYPDIRLVYWGGGNPFHHHQDLNRLRRAFWRPDTIVVHEPFWTATARHADIVLPTTLTLERDDIGGAPNDDRLIAMHRVLTPHGEARDDYEIFAQLSGRLGFRSEFTEDRTTRQWLATLYEQLATQVRALGLEAPDFDDFWEIGELELPLEAGSGTPLQEFRADPARHPLRTPSGRIEVYSPTVASFGYADCPGHPAWLEPEEWLGSPLSERFPLQLVANQPASRLHSQLDFGSTSQRSKVDGREPLRIHPDDAGARGIGEGDIVRVFNDRGACLAGARLASGLRPGVVQLSTGAWFDPVDPESPRPLCAHGNPNMVTRDAGTSSLAQGCIGQLSLVQVERFQGEPPPLRAYLPPDVEIRPRDPV